MTTLEAPLRPSASPSTGDIEEEFPSVSPKPAERIGHLHHDELENLDPVPENLNQDEQVETPLTHSLAEFEEFVGHPLPEEIKEELSKLKAEKIASLNEELQKLSNLAERLKTSPYSEWIKEGDIVVPSLTEDIGPDFIKILEQKVEEYLQTDLGQMELKEKQLKDFLANYDPSEGDIARAASLLNINPGKFSFVPSQKRKFAEKVWEKAEQYFKQKAQTEELFETGRKSPEQQQADQKANIEKELAQLAQAGRDDIIEELKKSSLWGVSRLQRPELSGVLESIKTLATVRQESKRKILEGAQETKFYSLIPAIARGEVSTEEAFHILKSQEGNPITIKTAHGSMVDFYVKEEEKLIQTLAEPSLLGLDITAADLQLLGQCLDKLSEIQLIFGVEDYDTRPLFTRAEKEIEYQQDLFSRSIGSEFDMYWHFSPFGLRIIGKKALSPSQATGNVMTGLHSRSIHFIKPAINGGQKSMVDYTQYAQVEGYMSAANKPIPDAFGIAVIYPLGALADRLPFRDEPVEEDRTADDVVFRESAEDLPQQSLPLEEAYILPLQTISQLQELRHNPDYANIIQNRQLTREELAERVTRRALELAGFEKEWIDEHLLPAVPYDKFRVSTEQEVYKETSPKLRARLPKSRTIILPLFAKREGFESHDINGSNGVKSGWRERLIRIEV